MVSCVLCASLGPKRSMIRFTTKANAQTHAAQHRLQTKCFDDSCISLDQMFEQCFPTFTIPQLVQKRNVMKKEGRQSLLDLCRTLLDGRVSKVSPRVTCLKCGSAIVICKQNSGRAFGSVIDHASAHLRIDLYECRQCGRGFGSKNTACVHLKTSHGHGWHSDYYVDKSHDFIDEIGASIKECFSEDVASSGKNARMIKLKNESTVRSRTKGSMLAVKRNQHCYRLIRQQVGDDGKIQCRLCPKTIIVKRGNGYLGDYAMGHAFLHLGKPIFRCKICSIVRANRCSMQNHLRSAHDLTKLNNYEIMTMLKTCYAGEPESK